MCVHCGGRPHTRDHAPSKDLLDDPLPNNLPVVEACESCNTGFSQDEEYVACFVECVICGTTELSGVQRPKIKRILAERPALAARLHQSRRVESGIVIWQPEIDRVQNVVVKLARGHVAYELSEPEFDKPKGIRFAPLALLNEEQLEEFERLDSDFAAAPSPEIGSRAFIRAWEGWASQPGHKWIIVQPGRYRYRVDYSEGKSVRMVLSEYLACWVAWR